MRIAAFLLYCFAALIFFSNALPDSESISMAWGFCVAAIASAIFVLDTM